MVERLYIHNYRCFINFELRPARTSLLLGYNGSGKTSIFDVLGAIQDLLVWNQDCSEAFPTATLTAFGDSVDQRFELDLASEWGTLRYALVLAHNSDQRTCQISSEEVTLDGQPLFRFRQAEVQLYRDDHSAARDTFSYAPRRSFLASLEPKPYNRKITWFKDYLTRVFILKLDPKSATSTSLADDPSLDRDGANFASWCRHLLQEEPDRMEQARATLQAVVPGFHQIRTVTAGRARVLVASFTAPGRKPFDLDFSELSDGQKALVILYVVLHAIGRESTLVCMDEPDNFVSIREIQPLLVELMNTTEDLQGQLLLISHSSEVIDFMGPRDAVLLERPEGGATRVGALRPEGTLRLSELMARGWHSVGGDEHE